jgi:hypothetical protein
MEISALDEIFKRGFDSVTESTRLVSDETKLGTLKVLLKKEANILSIQKMPQAKAALVRMVCHEMGVKNVKLLINACERNVGKLWALASALEESDPFAKDAKTVDQAAKLIRMEAQMLRKRA